MCLIALAYRASSRYPLIVAANRDESHARPTAAAAWWPNAPHVLGGRDLVAGGSWLAVDRNGRFAAVTNLRDAAPSTGPAPSSRGMLVSGYLSGTAPAHGFVEHAALGAERFGPFNMLVLDRHSLHYIGNRAAPRVLGTGVHVLGNVEPGISWPKLTLAAERLDSLLDAPDPTGSLLALLAERAPPVAGYDDRQVSPFQLHPIWGTRSSTILLIDATGLARFTERSFDAAGEISGEASFEFEVAPPL